jgi:DNA polymerase-4
MTLRRIAHLDMDAFFASVELLRYPQLKGMPVVVGGRKVPAPKIDDDGGLTLVRLGEYAGRGVVTTSTYEARKLGVFSGMGLMQSAKLAPEAVLLPADFEAYRHHSRLFKEAVAGVVSVIEDRGIDEIYLDLTNLPEDTPTLARRIKQAVYDATGLTCSIGISPNKLLSKICSDLDKPDGITLLSLDDLATRIWPLPVSKVNGIGPKATSHLAQMGIHTIGELAATPLATLQQQFGKPYGQWLSDAAHGNDDRPLVTTRQSKSLSRETTFERNLHVRHDRTELTTITNNLCQRVSDDLQAKGLMCRTVGLKVKFADFSVVTRDVSLPQRIQSASDLRQALADCLRRVVWHDRIRLLGVKASALSGAHQSLAPSPQLDFWPDGQ